MMSSLTQALLRGDLHLLKIAKCSFPTSSSQTCIFSCFRSSTPEPSIRAEVLTGDRGQGSAAPRAPGGKATKMFLCRWAPFLALDICVLGDFLEDLRQGLLEPLGTGTLGLEESGEINLLSPHTHTHTHQTFLYLSAPL